VIGDQHSRNQGEDNAKTQIKFRHPARLCDLLRWEEPCQPCDQLRRALRPAFPNSEHFPTGFSQGTFVSLISFTRLIAFVPLESRVCRGLNPSEARLFSAVGVA